MDLVLLDFGVNDYLKGNQMTYPERLSLERIMRFVMVGFTMLAKSVFKGLGQTGLDSFCRSFHCGLSA